MKKEDDVATKKITNRTVQQYVHETICGSSQRDYGAGWSSSSLKCLLSGSSKLTKKAPVIGSDPLLYEPTLIVKPEDVRQVPDHALAVGR